MASSAVLASMIDENAETRPETKPKLQKVESVAASAAESGSAPSPAPSASSSLSDLQRAVLEPDDEDLESDESASQAEANLPALEEVQFPPGPLFGAEGEVPKGEAEDEDKEEGEAEDDDSPADAPKVVGLDYHTFFYNPVAEEQGMICRVRRLDNGKRMVYIEQEDLTELPAEYVLASIRHALADPMEVEENRRRKEFEDIQFMGGCATGGLLAVIGFLFFYIIARGLETLGTCPTSVYRR